PAPRDIGEHGQDRQFIVVIPKNERIVPEQDETKSDDDQAGTDGAKKPVGRLCQAPGACDIAWFAAFHRNALQNHGLAFSHDEDLLLDAVRARGRKQSFRGLMKRLKPEAKSSVMHRYQGFSVKFEESFHGLFRIHVNFAAGWCLISADRKQGDVDLVALADFFEPGEISAVAAMKNRAAIHRDDESTEVAM